MFKKSKIAKTPTLLQMEAIECGAASLGIILGYYNKIVSLEQLRYDCGVSRDGSKASNIVKAAQKYDLIGKGIRRDIEDCKNINQPTMVFWNFNHFLILEGYKNGKFYLNDPASGRRTVTEEEFNESFTGILITFEKSNNFIEGGKTESWILNVFSKLENTKSAVFLIMLLGVLTILPSLVVPVFIKVFIDNILIHQMSSWMFPLIMGMIGILLIRITIQFFQEKLLKFLRYKMSVVSSNKFLWYILRLPMKFYLHRNAADLAYRMELNDEISVRITNDLIIGFLTALSGIVYLLVMFYFDINITLIVLLLTAINFLVYKKFSNIQKDLSLRYINEESKLSSTSMNGIQMIESIKASGRESMFFEKWSGLLANSNNIDQEQRKVSNIMNSIPQVISTINTIIVLILGSSKVMSGELTIGMLVAFYGFLEYYSAPVGKLVLIGSGIKRLQVSLTRVNDIYNNPVDDCYINEKEVLITNKKLSGFLDVKNLTFGYSTLDAPFIKDLNFSIKPGQRVALVGGSGSGKSTIAKLIAGIYKPWSGEILFDNTNRSKIQREVITSSISVVDQEIFLFEGSVKDIVSFWDKTIDEKTIIQACKDAEIHDVIVSRKDGYDTMINEGGSNFSGGQRQRIEIAKALAVNPTFLIMDEATSALDPKTEKIIDNNIRRKGCATLIIAHRLSTIRDCDEIIVLDKGKIVQRGSHEDLIKQDGLYAKLIEDKLRIQ